VVQFHVPRANQPDELFEKNQYVHQLVGGVYAIQSLAGGGVAVPIQVNMVASVFLNPKLQNLNSN
jgi:hypothetical protein